MLIFGKMSVDIRVMVTTPTSTIRMAMTVNCTAASELSEESTYYVRNVNETVPGARPEQVFQADVSPRATQQSAAALSRRRGMVVIANAHSSLAFYSAAALLRV